MISNIRIGTSGYHYPGPPPKGWRGAFYPDHNAKNLDQLQYYSQIFNTVEINSSFYGPPSETTTASWVKKTSEDFSFTMKLWQKFTHPRKIGHGGSTGEWEAVTEEDVRRFRAALQPLIESRKLGALVLQYPTGFTFTPENAEQLEQTLGFFPECAKAVELRHKSWSDSLERTQDLLVRYRSTWVLIDEPKFASSIRQTFEPLGNMLYFRAHGRNAKKWWHHGESWERYDYCYTRPEIKQLADKIKTAASRPGVNNSFAFFNNHARGNAAANAIMLAQELRVPLKAMPSEAMVASFPELARP